MTRFHRIKKNPMTRMITTTFTNGRLVRQSIFLNEGYFTSLKKIDWRTKRPFVKVVVIILVIGFFLILWKRVIPVAAPVIFTIYLLYGFIRPRISRKMRDEIEQEDEPDEPAERNA